MWIGIVVGIACAVQRLAMVWKPSAFFPVWDISSLAALSVIALLLQKPSDEEKHGLRRFFDAALAAAVFAAFPILSGLWEAEQLLRLGICGGAVYAVTEEMLCAIKERMFFSERGQTAVFVSGLLLILASQALNHIFL